MEKLKKPLSEYAFTLEQAAALLERIDLVEEMLNPLLSEDERRGLVRSFQERFGLSARTIRNYMRRYQAHGAAGLVLYARQKAPGPRYSHELQAAVIALLQENPRRSIPKVREILLQRDGVGEEAQRISERQFYRIAGNNGLDRKGRALLRDEQRRAYRSFEAPYAMALVQGDARDGIWLEGPDGKQRKTYLFAWIDDYSRKILYAQYYWDEKLPRMEDSFRKMALRYGLPEKIYLDNGSVYVSNHFRLVLHDLAVKKVHHPAYQAHCKGKVEAVMKKIKNDFQNEAQYAGFKTLEELNTALFAWIALKYDQQALATTGEAPGARFGQGLTVTPKRVTNLDEFMQYFLFRETRTVNKYGRIKLAGNSYPVTKCTCGAVVHIRYDPFDLRQVFVYDDHGGLLETTQPVTLTNMQAPHIPEETAANAQDVRESSRIYFENLRRLHLEAQRNAMPNLEYAKLAKSEDTDA